MSNRIQIAGENYSSPKTQKRPFLLVLILLLIATLTASAYYAYSNREELLFYFEKDKYQAATKKVQASIEGIYKGHLPDQATQKKIESLLTNVISENKTNSLLYYLKGSYHANYFLGSLKQKELLSVKIIFETYRIKRHFSTIMNNQHWRSAVSALEKAIALGLPQNEFKITQNYLVNLYFWAGKSYWQSVLKNVTVNNNYYIEYMKILCDNYVPAWDVLSSKLSKNLILFLKGIYHLRKEQIPLGFASIRKAQKLTVKKKTKDLVDKLILNNSYYLMGKIMQHQKNKKKQLAYYSKINLKLFLHENPWFLKEYNFLLLFLGKKKKSTQFLSKYEKSVLMRN